MLCKGACSAKKRALQRSVLCKGECSAKERALQRSVLCKEACSAKKRAKESALQRSVLCTGACCAEERALQRACSAKERAAQRSVLCRGACSAKKCALQSVLCKEACSAQERAKERALQRSVLQRSALCKEACCAQERALTRSVLCKEACSAQERAKKLQRSVLCKEARSAKKRALQRSVLCKDPEADWPSCSPQNKNRPGRMRQPKKNWARKKRMASWARQRQQITEAADGGARARTGADGAVVLNLRRGPGAYALLSRADGQLTRAGQHYYSHLGLRPPSKDFDYNQPLIREGPNDYSRRLTKLGKGFFRDKYYEYLVHVPVIIRQRAELRAQGLAAGERAGRGHEAPGAPHGGAGGAAGQAAGGGLAGPRPHPAALGRDLLPRP